MRTFHTGGVSGNDLTQGLPRVEELFEARKPKGLAIISETAGKVAVTDNKKKREVTVINENGESKDYLIMVHVLKFLTVMLLRPVTSLQRVV